MPAKESPGIARMRKQLGKVGSEKLRRAVLKDQKAAKKMVRRKPPARLFETGNVITVLDFRRS
jgi:hypothetical protein